MLFFVEINAGQVIRLIFHILMIKRT